MTSGSISKEAVRAFWDSRPCNFSHSTEPVGSLAYFEEVESRKRLVEPHIESFADFERWSGKSVLEVGCGMGTDGIRFSKAGASYTGIELSPVSLELAQRRFALYGVEGELLIADAECLDTSPLAGRTFDLIYSFGVLHHTVDPDLAIRQLRLMCHGNSELRIMLYARNSWKAALIRAGLDQPEAQNGCPIALTFTRDEAVDFAEKAGFVVTSLEQTHIFPWQVEDYVQHIYRKQPWFEVMPPEVFAALEAELGWHLLLKCTPL